MPFPKAYAEPKASSLTQHYDCLILISNTKRSQYFSSVEKHLEAYANIDARVGQQAVLMVSNDAPNQRVFHVPLHDLERDFDDVRRVFDASREVSKQLVAAGINAPLIEVNLEGLSADTQARYKEALGVAYLGLCQGLWQPLEARQDLPEQDLEPVKICGLLSADNNYTNRLNATEAGKRVARDLCGTEPERMAPPGFANYCVESFKDSVVDVTVIDDEQVILSEYPLLHAVARASIEVKRHQPRIIRLEYIPEGDITKTLLFAGKGITFDTGGADLKVNGHMAGMSRDKGGAAAVAGFMKAVSLLQPKGVKVVAEIGAVRNSIGAEAFIPDEIITSHAGVRVRVGNTDAEGRMLLGDLLSHLREDAVNEINPELFSVATLTGHAAVAFGPYTALVENGPARSAKVSQRWSEAGETWGDPVEPSLSRREDFDFIKPRTKADDVLSSNNAPSVSTVRGHQFPMAFLSIASGLDKHAGHTQQPLAFTHVDIAGSGVENLDWQHGKPTGAPVACLINTYL
jgi:leucyl aminopeptidase